MKHSVMAALAAALCVGSIASANAHVTLETREAAPASTYKAVLRVGHGCDGAATTAIRIRIPDGASAVKPMPKPGWTLATKEGPLAKPITDHGRSITTGVVEITWTGGELPDAWYDEFVFRVKLPDDKPGTLVHFPVVQECGQAVHRWIEIPEAGKSADDYKEPAPAVKLMAKP
jgi:uncharacterized protein YcnI